MNGIRASRMAAAVKPTQQNPTPPGGFPATSNGGTGMMGTQSAATAGPGMQSQVGLQSHAPAYNPQYPPPPAPTPGGVRAIAAAPPLQGPPPAQFDPNDPANAALAGYMNGA